MIACSSIKLIVTDLDGTLLNDQKQISPYTIKIIQQLRHQGIRFAIATARPVRGVIQTFPELPFDDGIFHNEAILMHEKQRIAEFGISDPVPLLHSLLSVFPHLALGVEVQDQLYANFEIERIWPKEPYFRVSDFSQIQGKIADKIILELHHLDEMELYRPYLPENLYLQCSENRIGMIMNNKATKSQALQLLTKEYGISLFEVAAFGDDYNDLDMLQSCGIGIAMKNALTIVKASAKEQCESNNQDGVAHWIEKHLLSSAPQ